jgi:hypothetical protein
MSKVAKKCQKGKSPLASQSTIVNASDVDNLSKNHPLRRIREAFKNASEASGLRKYFSSADFASLLDRAPSSIRNVECGHTKKWDRLARKVEEKTGVSAQWMLGNPKPTDPILGVDGNPWVPERHLDHLGGAGGNIRWRSLLMTNPAGVAKLASRIVEIKLKQDFLGGKSEGSDPETAFLKDLVELLHRYGCLSGERVSDLVLETVFDDVDEIITAITGTRRPRVE